MRLPYGPLAPGFPCCLHVARRQVLPPAETATNMVQPAADKIRASYTPILSTSMFICSQLKTKFVPSLYPPVAGFWLLMPRGIVCLGSTQPILTLQPSVLHPALTALALQPWPKAMRQRG